MVKSRWLWIVTVVAVVSLLLSGVGCLKITPPPGAKTVTTPTRSGFLPYNDQANGFSISYPADWERIPEQLLKQAEQATGGGSTVVVGFWAPQQAVMGFTPNFTVSRIQLAREMGVQDGFQEMKAQAETLTGYAFKSKKDLLIESIPAVKYVYEISPRTGMRSATMNVFLVQGTTAWKLSFSCLADSYPQLEPQFDSLANSFHFIAASGGDSMRPVVKSFTATPDTISVGQNATLSWEVTGALTINIAPNVGTVGPSGSQTVAPKNTTAYTLTAVREGWTATRTITVQVSSALKGMPDLAITDISLTGTTVYYKIKNQGDLVSKGCRQYLYINGLEVARNYAEAVAPGQEWTQSFSNYNYQHPGGETSEPVSIKVCADVENEVNESDEGNNCTTVTWGFRWAYNFAEKAHYATWRSEAGELKWPMDAGDKRGAAFVVQNAVLEDGLTYSPCLAMYPQQVTNGWIMGRFADYYQEMLQFRSRPMELPLGVKFTAQVGLRKGANTDGVRCALGWIDATGSMQLFSKMDVTYDGKLQPYQVDLKDFAGKKLEFVLWVEAKGSWEDDWFVWVEPKMEQQ